MVHPRLIELEAELVAKEQSERGLDRLPEDCEELLRYIEHQFGVRLSDPVPARWCGWLSYRRNRQSLMVVRGRAFREGLMGKWRAGFDVDFGNESISEHLRGFDVVPPQDLDHLLINFGNPKEPRVFLWYGENIAPYRLIYFANVGDDPHEELHEACVEACVWIAKRPKEMTLKDYLLTIHPDVQQ